MVVYIRRQVLLVHSATTGRLGALRFISFITLVAFLTFLHLTRHTIKIVFIQFILLTNIVLVGAIQSGRLNWTVIVAQPFERQARRIESISVSSLTGGLGDSRLEEHSAEPRAQRMEYFVAQRRRLRLAARRSGRRAASYSSFATIINTIIATTIVVRASDNKPAVYFAEDAHL